jgi:hypothetical protein
VDKKTAVVLDQREKGQFPLSIGTSLAFEGIFGVLPEKKVDPPPVSEFPEIWVNTRTLFRNLYGALTKEASGAVIPKDFAKAIYEEMLIIQGIVQDKTRGRSTVVFYICTYKSLPGMFKNAIFKEPKTENQKFYATFENKTVDELLILLKSIGQEGLIVKLDSSISGSFKAALFLTHYPVDLLNATKFPQMALMESHTGTVKKELEWHTKLKGGKDMPRVPFNRMTIQVFGDSGDMFSPYPGDVKTALKDLAEKYKWTSVVTKDRILMTIGLSKMPMLEGLVRKLYLL